MKALATFEAMLYSAILMIFVLGIVFFFAKNAEYVKDLNYKAKLEISANKIAIAAINAYNKNISYKLYNLENGIYCISENSIIARYGDLEEKVKFILPIKTYKRCISNYGGAICIKKLQDQVVMENC